MESQQFMASSRGLLKASSKSSWSSQFQDFLGKKKHGKIPGWYGLVPNGTIFLDILRLVKHAGLAAEILGRFFWEPIWAAQAGQRWRGTVLALDLLGQILYPQSHLVLGGCHPRFQRKSLSKGTKELPRVKKWSSRFSLNANWIANLRL